MKKVLTIVCLLMLLFSCVANAGTVKKEFVHRGITYSVEVDWPAYSTFDLTAGPSELQYDEEINEMEYQLNYYAKLEGNSFGQTFSFGNPCTRSQNRTLRIGDRTVKVVGKQQTEHLFNDWQYLNEEQHIHWCQNGFCIKKEKEEHSYSVATCMHKAACEGCGVEHGEVDKNNHVNKVILPAVAPTEKECGWTEGLKCADCETIIIPQQPLYLLPKTGDGTNLALLAVLAAAGMIGMTVILRRKNEA